MLVDNEIDREAFLELSESEVKDLVPKLGLAKKISRLQFSVCSKLNLCNVGYNYAFPFLGKK